MRIQPEILTQRHKNRAQFVRSTFAFGTQPCCLGTPKGKVGYHRASPGHQRSTAPAFHGTTQVVINCANG